MIHPRIGDLLEIRENGKRYYVVVLTNVVMFGGNIVFAYHNGGEKRAIGDLSKDPRGFNVCTDLLLPKREARVTRMHRFDDVTRFWCSEYAKDCVEIRRGVKAREWFIYRVDALSKHVARVAKLTREYRHAMDRECVSFNCVAAKVRANYTPDQNEHI